MEPRDELSLIAPCGMNCGVCIGYLREKKKCPSCRGPDESKPVTRWKCKIKNCPTFQEGNPEFCFECEVFPCSRMKTLDKRYRTKYNMSMVENLENIKNSGIAAFLESERLRWTCPECGGTICVHRGYCYSCGEKKPEKKILDKTAEDYHMNDVQIIDLTPENIAQYGVCGYKDVKKQIELRRKIDWFREYYPKGLRIKAVISEQGGYQGMLEYIPGKYAHRPVDAEGYMFIHCIFVGFKNEFKGKGYASSLIDECIREAKNGNMYGVAVVTRKGAFMAKKDIFVKKGFVQVDRAKPDFEVMVLKFNQDAPDPKFKDMEQRLKDYREGLFVMRSVQCPYTEKNVNAILESARDEFGLDANVIDLKDSNAAQNSPCAFGTFCIVYNGEIISHHPISNTRFLNIMKEKIES